MEVLQMAANTSPFFGTRDSVRSIGPVPPPPPTRSDTSGHNSPREITSELSRAADLTPVTEDGLKGASNSTIINTRSAVGIFERWLYEENKSDQRKIETIPPQELDHLLSLFWVSVQSRVGQYRPGTLNNLRARLERHLKACGYPCSIVKSDIFTRSRAAFRDRIASLRSKDTSETVPDSPF